MQGARVFVRECVPGRSLPYPFNAASLSCIADGMESQVAFSIIARLVPVCAAAINGSTPVPDVRRRYASDRMTIQVQFLHLRSPREPLIQMASEGVAIRLREGRRTSADIAARTHGVHEVPHREHASDRVR